jgi:hypothetical protein
MKKQNRRESNELYIVVRNWETSEQCRYIRGKYVVKEKTYMQQSHTTREQTKERKRNKNGKEREIRSSRETRYLLLRREHQNRD